MTRPAPALDPDPAREPLDLIYRLGDRPPLVEACLVGFQHVLAVFVGIITPPLIIGGALGLDIADVSTLVSMSLLISGIVVGRGNPPTPRREYRVGRGSPGGGQVGR